MHKIQDLHNKYAAESLHLLMKDIEDSLHIMPGHKGMTKEQGVQLHNAWATVSKICKIAKYLDEHFGDEGQEQHHSGDSSYGRRRGGRRSYGLVNEHYEHPYHRMAEEYENYLAGQSDGEDGEGVYGRRRRRDSRGRFVRDEHMDNSIYGLVKPYLSSEVTKDATAYHGLMDTSAASDGSGRSSFRSSDYRTSRTGGSGTHGRIHVPGFHKSYGNPY